MPPSRRSSATPSGMASSASSAATKLRLGTRASRPHGRNHAGRMPALPASLRYTLHPCDPHHPPFLHRKEQEAPCGLFAPVHGRVQRQGAHATLLLSEAQFERDHTDRLFSTG